MVKRTLLFIAMVLLMQHIQAQTAYADSVIAFQKKYVARHEVVTGEDKQYFRFFPATAEYRIEADVEILKDGKLVTMETSGWLKKTFREYAIARFTLHDTLVALTLYQPQALPGSTIDKNYLFLPFTDATSGNESYGAGRYLDLKTSDIQERKMLLDFNKVYNPYCAFVAGKYNCPVPPAGNHLAVAIPAGEQKFGIPTRKAEAQ